MLRALIDGFWMLYYRWAMSAMNPAHPDAAHVVLMHAIHRAQLERFLQGSAARLTLLPTGAGSEAGGRRRH
jgi:hypothetical protein